MKKILFSITLVFLSVLVIAQDTTVIQTLTFDSITARRGIWEFPDSTNNYRKILMSYTLKCDAATTQDNLPCGEWDYLTYTNVYDHTGILDSNYAEHAQYLTGASAPEILNTSDVQGYSLYQHEQYILNIDSVISETVVTIGSGSTQMDFGETTDGRAQFFWPDTLLTQMGLSAGMISGLKLEILTPGSELFSLKMKLRELNSFDEGTLITDGFTEVYNENTQIVNSGWTSFNFHTPFLWNGTSGILVEFSFDNENSGLSNIVKGEVFADVQGAFSSESDNCLEIYGDRFVKVPTDSMSPLISDEITVSFWQYGDPELQPQNDYIFEAYDGNNKRVISTHLPWSNGNVYWDAGNTGGTYDRIYKSANTSDFEGKWNHWALTKNTNTGYMRMYLNGVQWHQGNNMTLSMDGIEKFIIGASGAQTGFYDGYINEFRVWNKELPDSLISQWMYKTVDNTHPLWNNLVCYYNFDQVSGYEVIDLSGVTGNALLMGAPNIIDVPGERLYMNQEATLYRPNISFIQGDYISSIDTVIDIDTVYHSPLSIVEFAVGINNVYPMDTIWHYMGGWNYVYDTQGMIVDSIFFTIQTAINNSILSYYEPPYEIINMYEIGRYITPYGIGLDLGPDGFTWVYDVTDYAPLLSGMVDISAGNQQELIDLKFLMIEGTPARDVKEITRIWGSRRSYSYNNLDGDISLKNKRIGLNTDAEQFKVRTRFTGHGHNSSTGGYPHCCEWKDNTHYLLINSDTVNQWHIWQDFECAQNPVYPQGGTWPGSREGWCPGDKVKDNEFEITEYITGDSVDIDYDISDIPANNPGMGGGNYVVAMQLMQYGAPNFTNDAEIVDVISPNKFGYYSRVNPICFKPQIYIRNSGSAILSTMEIEYSVSGGQTETYEWTGSLNFMEEEIISLPIPDEDFWIGNGENIFTVNILSANGMADDNSYNNIFKSTFNTPDVYDHNFIIMYRSNNLPQDNYYEIHNVDGNIVASRYTANATTVYYDTLNLLPGCYTLNFYDTGNDGLAYWAYPEQGSGYLKLKKIGGGTMKVFEPEFGYNIMYSFTIGDYTNVEEINNDIEIDVFPNPASDFVSVDINGYNGDMNVDIIDMTGRIVLSENRYVNNNSLEKFNISEFRNGLYMIKLSGDNFSFSESIIVN